MMQTIRTTLIAGSMLCLMLLFWCDVAPAAGLRVAPSVVRVAPGQDLALDVVAEGIPDTGLSGAQFRLTVTAPGGVVGGTSDLNQAGTTSVTVATPLLISPPTATRSGVGDFFWNARGPNGILVMDNEPLVNGAGLYTLALTNGATPPSGNGVVARFLVRVGKDVPPGNLSVTLSDVLLLDNGPAYQLEYATGATVEIQCVATVPTLLGSSLTDATAALAAAGLTSGAVTEEPNPTGAKPLRVALSQSVAVGTQLACGTAINMTINTPPVEVADLAASQQVPGTVHLSWTPSTSSDVAGYRVYRQGTLATDLQNPTATGADFSGLTPGVPQQFRVTAYDTFNNESAGVYTSATPLDADSLAPTGSLAINGGALYTTARTVLLTLSAADPSGIGGMCISNSAACGAWETYATSRAWDLEPGDGVKTVYVWYKDGKGNSTAQPYSAAITLDTTRPVVTQLALPKGEYPLNSAKPITVPLVFVADDNLQVVDYCLTETNDAAACVWKQSRPDRFTFTGFGSHTLYAFARDAAGNVSDPVSASVATVATATLTVTISGTAGGSVNGDGIACSSPPLSGICAVDYPLNTLVSLTPNSAGLFTGWTGACSGTGACSVKLAGNLAVSATFASAKTARLACAAPAKEYATLQAAYADATDGCVIMAQQGTLLENLHLNALKNVTIKGGYNADFSAVTGVTSLDGVLIIGKGSAIFDHLLVTGSTSPLVKDSEAPTGSILINQGAPFTGSPLVTLDFAATDPSGVSEVCLTTSDTCTEWEPFVPTPRPWLFSNGEGMKSVTARFRDAMGNTTQPYSAQITLDTTAPTITSLITPTGDYPLNVALPLAAPLTLAATDNYHLADYCVTEQSSPAACSWQTHAPDKVTLGGFGPHTISAFARDAAGNISQPATASINLLPTASLVVELNGTGGGYIKSDPSGILCNYAPLSGACTAEFPFNSSVLLQAFPDSNSVLSGWSPPCGGTGDCLLKLTDNLKVTGAIDHVAPILMTCVTPTKGYSLLQQAYDEAPDGCVLKVRAVSLQEDLTLGQTKTVKIRGGYDKKYESVIGVTVLKGVSILKGMGVVENIEIK